MDKDRVVGSAKVVKGKIKEAVGKAVGDAKLESQGKADKIEGKVQNAVGGLKDGYPRAILSKSATIPGVANARSTSGRGPGWKSPASRGLFSGVPCASLT